MNTKLASAFSTCTSCRILPEDKETLSFWETVLFALFCPVIF